MKFLETLNSMLPIHFFLPIPIAAFVLTLPERFRNHRWGSLRLLFMLKVNRG